MTKSSDPSVPSSIRPYVEEISERLRSGHAAVMVGSGFSKNVVSSGRSRPDLPNWNQLGDLLLSKLHGKKPDKHLKYLNILKLADEVQAAFGRPALNELVKNAIPDLDYEPTELHVKLLSLPWSDVFTTNYDTLLERTRVSITSRRYDLVVDQVDLVYSEKPRIIKLHGSLPTGPFVITEEDYRCYPHDNAPFVNTVHQALLENTLCLLGFSGDDPNFSQWIGWIRDKFGQQNAPKMYLVGALKLTDGQKRLLNMRNIVTVDLTAYKDIRDDHYKCLERFLDFLSEKNKKENNLSWPDSDVKFSVPENNKNKLPQITRVVEHWRSLRDSYPSWVVVPEDRRGILWRDTFSWIDFITVENDLSEFFDLEFAFELIWRIEKCLCPIVSNLGPLLEKLLEKYKALLDTKTPFESFGVTLKSLTGRGLKPETVREMYQHLQLRMLRFYREEGKLEDWEVLYKSIEQNKASLTPEMVASFCYEKCMLSLFELDSDALKESLAEWPSNEYLPYWNAKKAGLLAEVGRISEAEEILKESLTNIRSKLNLKPVTSDYTLVSQESYVMMLLRWVQQSIAIEKNVRKSEHTTEVQKSPDQYSDRWHFLKQYKCDPLGEMRILENKLDRPYVERQDVTEKEEFDVGRVTRTRHFGGWDQEAINAYNFLRFCEEVGLPFRIPRGELAPKAVENALSRISGYSSYWAMAILVRNGDERAVDRIFNRTSLSDTTTEFVDNLVDRYLKPLIGSSADIQKGNPYFKDNIGTVLAGLVPEILSRLCCKCSLESKMKLFSFLQDVYRSESKGNYSGIKNLTIRLLESFSAKQRMDLFPQILGFPVMENLTPQEQSEFINPFLILSKLPKITSKQINTELPDKEAGFLLDKARSSNTTSRKWAIRTVGYFYDMRCLNNDQQIQFAEALWSNLDESGLPSGTDYLRSDFLNLPHPPDVEPFTLIRDYIRAERFSSNKYGSLPVFEDVVHTSKNTKWTEKDTVDVFDRLVEWWDADKGNLKLEGRQGFFDSLANEYKSEFANMIDVLTKIIRLDFNLDHRKQPLYRLVSELKEYHCPALRLECACLHMFPDWRRDVLERIDRDLAAEEPNSLNDCFKAILVFAARTGTRIVEEDFSEALDSLGQIVRMQKYPGLPNAFETITGIVTDYPWAFTEKLEEYTILGLEKSAQNTIVSKGTQEVSVKLRVRKRSAELAYVLHRYYLDNQNGIPNVITDWKSICASDSEFAEIKNEWLE